MYFHMQFNKIYGVAYLPQAKSHAGEPYAIGEHSTKTLN